MEKVGKRTDRIKMDVILAAGCMLRLFYVLFSTIYDRQYDIGMIDLDAGHTVTGGHLAYIQYLYENWKLPDFDPTSVYQFNHPPLHHYLCALWMKLCSFYFQYGCAGGVDPGRPVCLLAAYSLVPFADCRAV